VTLAAAAQLASSHYRAGRYAEAVKIYRQILAVRPDNAAVHCRLGVALFVDGMSEEAKRHYDRALTLDPDHADSHYNIGIYYQRVDDLEKAVDHYRRALDLKSDYFQAYNNLGNVLRVMGRYSEAIASYRRALAIKPDHAAAHMNLGIALLVTGDLEAGWPEYEERWHTKTYEGKRPKLATPPWEGGELAGRRLLIYAEQGLGDAIQFSRYADPLAARGATIILQCQRPLASLMRTVPGVQTVIAPGDPLPDHDCNASIMSLPGLCGTTLDSIPCRIPYLRASADVDGRFDDLLAAAKGKRKIGIVWAGSSDNPNDRRRSCRLDHFLKLAQVPGVALFSLQKEQPAQDRLESPEVTDLGPLLDDFAATATAIERLDLIITVDTAVAHLAGALGRPLWLAIPFAPDWRWLLDREDSPWYPTARLFRQRHSGDWEGVFARLGAALTGLG
jgi:lipoprotein NlpI